MRTISEMPGLNVCRIASVDLPFAAELWLSDLDESGGSLESFWGTLSFDEQARSKRFHFTKDCRRFVLRRGVLRQFLGSYLDRPPASIQFEYNRYGKPTLQGIHFSLSSSDGLALWAFTLERPIGVDLERTGSSFPAALIRRWTTSEALLKAQGVGFAHGESSIDGRWDCISFEPSECSVASLAWLR